MAKPVREHKLNKLRVGRRIVFAVLYIIIAIIVLIVLVATPGVNTFAAGAGLVLALILFIFALKDGIPALLKLRRNPRIVLYEKGLVYSDRSGKKRWAWQQISRVTSDTRRRLLGGTTRNFALYQGKEKALTIDSDYREAGKLSEYIAQATGELLLKRYVKAYQAGKTVTFGKHIKLNDIGILFDKKVLPWEKAGGFKMARNALVFYSDEDGALSLTLPLRDVPNVYVLIKMVEAVIGGIDSVEWSGSYY